MMHAYFRSGLTGGRAILASMAVAVVASAIIVGVRAQDVDATHCNETYYGVSYNSDGFFDGRCADIPNFPNTGQPFVHPTNGNGDSVGYVIPRTSKDFSTASEALAQVTDKNSFYNRLRFHYITRGEQGGNAWAKDGAAFVVFSMIGKNPPASRDLTAADWVDFKRRLDNPNLTMALDTDYPLSPNSTAIYDSDGVLDFYHFSNTLGERGPSFVFKVGTRTVGSIERKCANLMGRFVLPQANQWTIDGSSYVDNMSEGTARRQGDSRIGAEVSADPGEALEWDHELRNDSDYNMDRDITYSVDRTGFGNGWDASKVMTGNARGAANTRFVNLAAPGATNSRYVVRASDGGRTLCQRITWNDAAWNNTGSASSETACAFVPFNYNLTPSVTGPNGIGTVGGPIPTVTPRVNNALTANASKTTDSPPVVWELKRVEVLPGRTIPLTQQQNGVAPCTHYGNDCIEKGEGTRTFPAGSVTLEPLTGETIPPNTPVGTRICYTLSVRPYSQASTDWRHSAPVCIKVSKQPKVQVWGHDARTRGGIETGTTIVNSGGTNKLFGSWVEYGGFSVGANSGFASGSGLNTGNDVIDSSDPGNVWNKLTFANVDNSGRNSYGMFTLPADLPTITSQFISASSSGTFGGGNMTSLESGKYDAGSVLIEASTVGQAAGVGKSIIIVSSGTVTIGGNIVYEGSGASGVFTDIKQIPQVVIIAPVINIEGDVTQIDAWLLTTTPAGMINTCSDVPLTAPLNATICNQVLTVNGPVVTQHLHLRRTGGSNSVATAGDPAEIFNLRPDAYIWAHGRASQSGKAQTVYTVEMPPRF